MSHTPGPWKISDKKQGELQAVAIEPKIALAFTKDGMDNARLIAAAPDLLEALKYVMSAHGEQLHDAFDMAQKAIAKAEGSFLGRNGQ